jgi:UDP-N-acetylmuramyl pentapeptide phosphotransferase/UDP-N-acetylglucosamine-1-phosphate transferase
MQQVIFSISIAFFISFYAIPVVIYVAKTKKLYDMPDERKVHTSPVPLLGGLGIFVGFILSLLLNISSNEVFFQFQYLIASFFIVFFLGIGDDIMVLSPLKKFVGQLVVAFILIFKSHLLITNLHGFLGIGALNETASYLLTYFTIIVIINAFNLIDGVDGLAGSIGLIAATLFGIWFFMNGDMAFTIIAFSLIGSIGAFLIYNFNPAKIFMGDAGSMLLGLANAILVIHFIEAAPVAAKLPVIASPAIGFGILLIPLLDTLRVFCIRLSKGRSPFFPDRNHIHHLFLDRGFSHKSTTLTIAFFSLLFAVFSFLIESIGNTWIIIAQSVLFFSGIYMLYSIKPTSLLHVVQNKKGKVFIEENKWSRRITMFSRKEPVVAVEEK